MCNFVCRVHDISNTLPQYPHLPRQVGLYLVTLTQAEKLLLTYEFDELLEMNDITHEEALVCLMDNELIKVNILPVDYYETSD